MLPSSWSWKLLKLTSETVLAQDSGKAIHEVHQDLNSLIPISRGLAGELVGSDVFAFEDAYSTHWGANVTSDGRLISDLSRQGIGTDKPHFSFGKPRLRAAKRVKGTVATLTIEHRSNYFHFFSDALSRFQLIRNLKRQPDYIYIQANLSYQKEILLRLGYEAHQIIDSSAHPFIRAERLLIPSYVSNFSFLSVNSIAYLRSELLKDQSWPLPASSKIVHISRNDAPRRRLLNENKLLEQLSPFDVESVVLSGLSVKKQIELFAGAGAIIIPTGAGLANLIFARPDLLLILITPPNWFGESALEIVKPFGLKVLNIVLSDYPDGADAYAQDVSLTEKEIHTMVEAIRSMPSLNPR